MKTLSDKTRMRGNILVALLFVMLFATLSITLLTHSIGHQRIMRIRTLRSRALSSVRDDLNMEMHHVFSTTNHMDLSALVQPSRGIFSTENFPSRQTNMTDLAHDFTFRDSSCAGMEHHDVIDRIRATARHDPYEMEGEIQCRILSGAIPLRLVPIFLTGELPASTSAREWLWHRNVSVDGSTVPIVRETPITLDIKRIAINALHLEGTDLTWSEIRSRLGLPIMEAPPPPGVYLLRDLERIDAILVQGDLTKLGFCRTDAGQAIHLEQGGHTYVLEYEPEGTVVDCWDMAPISTTVFSECIVVNGNCPRISTIQDKEKPGKAFHPDSDIVLLVTGESAITSSLESDHLGIRHTSPPGLTLICGKSGILDQGESGITVDSGEDVTLDTSLITSGIISTSKESVNIHGTLCAGTLENKGKVSVEYAAGENRLLDDLLTHHLCLVQRIFLSRIEEVYDER